VKWLFEREFLDALPRNLGSRQHKFERPQQPIPTFTDDEVRLLVTNAKGPLKVALLLALNCGFTARDISDLKKTEIDFQAGTIARRRSKTARHRSSFVVSYKLWPDTLRFLKENLSSDPVVALTATGGGRWVVKAFRGEGDRVRRSDGLAAAFERLKERCGITGHHKSFKVWRKTSATKLKSHSVYRSLVPHFLGHSPQNISDHHYAQESQALLDEAVVWLQTALGL
jgi:integrase